MAHAVLEIVVSLVVLFTMQWKLALILVVSIPVIGVAIAILMTKCHPLFELMQQKIDELNEGLAENLVGIRVVKAFCGRTTRRRSSSRPTTPSPTRA